MNFIKSFTRKKQEVAPVTDQILTNEMLMKRSEDADINQFLAGGKRTRRRRHRSRRHRIRNRNRNRNRNKN